MRSYPSLLLAAFIGYVAATAATTERRIVQVQYAGLDLATHKHTISGLKNGQSGIVFGYRDSDRIAVEFSPQSDRAALAALEKVSSLWYFKPSPQHPNVSCDAMLRLTVMSDQAPTQMDDGSVIWRVALREWKLELPALIKVDNLGEENYFQGEFLVDKAKVLLGETLTDEELARFVRSDSKRITELEKEQIAASPFSLRRHTGATPDILRSINEQIKSPANTSPTKLNRQAEEFRRVLAQIEQEAGGCITTPLENYGDQWGFQIRPPSLAAAGGPDCDLVMNCCLVQALPLAERKKYWDELIQLKSEFDELYPRCRAIRLAASSGLAGMAEQDKEILQRFSVIGKRLRTLDDFSNGLPMAHFKDLGIIITPTLFRPNDVPPISKQTIQAMESFYRSSASVVEYYDLEAWFKTMWMK